MAVLDAYLHENTRNDATSASAYLAYTFTYLWNDVNPNPLVIIPPKALSPPDGMEHIMYMSAHYDRSALRKSNQRQNLHPTF
jgi:hypothetical protein